MALFHFELVHSILSKDAAFDNHTYCIGVILQVFQPEAIWFKLRTSHAASTIIDYTFSNVSNWNDIF